MNKTKRKKIRIPADLERPLAEDIEHIVNKRHINRTKLLRMIIKYGVKNIDNVLEHGDPIWPGLYNE